MTSNLDCVAWGIVEIDVLEVAAIVRLSAAVENVQGPFFSMMICTMISVYKFGLNWTSGEILAKK